MIALFDNPNTRRRELWRDGICIAFVTVEAIELCPEIKEVLEFPLHAGKFVDGKVVGNPLALEQSL